jgi:hypothetical protein
MSGENGQRRFDYDQYGGRPPHVRSSDTSREAAESVVDNARQLRAVVFSRILGSGEVGMTCDQVEVAMNGRHQTISARIRELVNEGRIIDTGERRPTRSGRGARVYLATCNAPTHLVTQRETAIAQQPWHKITLGEVAAAFATESFGVTKKGKTFIVNDGVDIWETNTLDQALAKIGKAVNERKVR